MRKEEREFIRAIERLGVQVVGSRRGGSHLHLRLRAPDGRELLYIAAPASGCAHAFRNRVADVRRFLRGRAVRAPH